MVVPLGPGTRSTQRRETQSARGTQQAFKHTQEWARDYRQQALQRYTRSASDSAQQADCQPQNAAHNSPTSTHQPSDHFKLAHTQQHPLMML
jgi:hypothetical protein